MATTTSAHQILSRAHMNFPATDLPPELWELVERYRSDLVNQGYALLGSMEDAEEVAQETFCEAFAQQGQLAEVQSLGAWLRTINKANALNRLRSNQRKKRKESRKQIELPGRQMTTGGFSMMELRDAVTKAIEDLPEVEREAVVLHYWEHLNYDQIAERLRISPRTVWQRLHDAYLRLYPKLTGYVETGPAVPNQE